VATVLNQKEKENLQNEYSKCILFDYSYQYFYEDGYGKNYKILNLKEFDEINKKLYLTASLLTFFQQKQIYQEFKSDAKLQDFYLENPLCIFVGSQVNTDESDIEEIIKFFKEFLANTNESIRNIQVILEDKHSLVDGKNNRLFVTTLQVLKIKYLKDQAIQSRQIYQDIQALLFHIENPNALHVHQLELDEMQNKNGEIAIKIYGMKKPFALINIGNASDFIKLIKNKYPNMICHKNNLNDSLFQKLSEIDSPIQFLIGSKKFTEGWNNYRVSTMMLLNIGKTEGSEIIQLFGRGIRLHGYQKQMKRRESINDEDLEKITYLSDTQKEYIDILETLYIFGLKANYMDNFREVLKDENIQIEKIEIVIQVPRSIDDHIIKSLYYIDVKNASDFYIKNHFRIHLPPPNHNDYQFIPKNIILDKYPKIKGDSDEKPGDFIKEVDILNPINLILLNFDQVYFEILNFKKKYKWHNVIIIKEDLWKIISDSSWYKLKIPSNQLTKYNGEQSIKEWHKIVVELLRLYCQRFFNNIKSQYLEQHMYLTNLTPDHPNFIKEYRFTMEIDDTHETQLKHIYDLIKKYNDNLNKKNHHTFHIDKYRFTMEIDDTHETQSQISNTQSQNSNPFLPQSQLFQIYNEITKYKDNLNKVNQHTFNFQNMIKSIDSQIHLFNPLIYFDPSKSHPSETRYNDQSNSISVPTFEENELETLQVQPVPLNYGEHHFVEHISQYIISNRDQEQFKDFEIYLLRNTSRLGVGFYESNGNFYPDFMLWLKKGNRQSINFFDPKGLFHMEDLSSNHKIQLFSKIKDIQNTLNQNQSSLDIRLNSFIISVTKFSALYEKFGTTTQMLNDWNVYEITDQDYLENAFKKILDDFQS
jgi:hypothetical protein